mgnify:CR=1 FL=1
MDGKSEGKLVGTPETVGTSVGSLLLVGAIVLGMAVGGMLMVGEAVGMAAAGSTIQ